jgi:hypothetical protein
MTPSGEIGTGRPPRADECHLLAHRPLLFFGALDHRSFNTNTAKLLNMSRLNVPVTCRRARGIMAVAVAGCRPAAFFPLSRSVLHTVT